MDSSAYSIHRAMPGAAPAPLRSRQPASDDGWLTGWESTLSSCLPGSAAICGQLPAAHSLVSSQNEETEGGGWRVAGAGRSRVREAGASGRF
jgi:hypothetical protein